MDVAIQVFIWCRKEQKDEDVVMTQPIGGPT